MGIFRILKIFVVSFLFIVQLNYLASEAYECTKGIEDSLTTEHCPNCLTPPELKIDLKTLSIGDKLNQLNGSGDGRDVGEMCIDGEAFIPKGYMSKNHTLDLYLRVKVDMGYPIALPCSWIKSLLESKAPSREGEEDYDYDYDYDYEEEEEEIIEQVQTTISKGSEEMTFDWINDLLDRFDDSHCKVNDICSLLGKGMSLRTIMDEMMEDNTVEDLDMFDKYNHSKANACDVDFLAGELKNLKGCYPLTLPEGFDRSAFEQYAFGPKFRIELTLELMRRDITKDNGDHVGDYVLCLFIPLNILFDV